MDKTKELIDAVYLDRVQRAREMSFEDKLLAGPRLFEEACERMRDGIRADFPQATSADVERILRERLDVARRLEDWHCPVTTLLGQ